MQFQHDVKESLKLCVEQPCMATWLRRLVFKTVRNLALAALMALCGRLIPTGIWNEHHLRSLSSKVIRVDAREITSPTLSHSATGNELCGIAKLDNL